MLEEKRREPLTDDHSISFSRRGGRIRTAAPQHRRAVVVWSAIKRKWRWSYEKWLGEDQRAGENVVCAGGRMEAKAREPTRIAGEPRWGHRRRWQGSNRWLLRRRAVSLATIGTHGRTTDGRPVERGGRGARVCTKGWPSALALVRRPQCPTTTTTRRSLRVAPPAREADGSAHHRRPVRPCSVARRRPAISYSTDRLSRGLLCVDPRSVASSYVLMSESAPKALL